MSSYSSSLVFRKNISHQVWQHLVELWLTMATNVETQLFTQDTLSRLLENDSKIQISLRIDNFYLLTGSNFNALLLKRKTASSEIHQACVIFDREAIINELINLGNQQEQKNDVINCLRTKFIVKLSNDSDVSLEFMAKAVKLLIDSDNSLEQTQYHKLPHDGLAKSDSLQQWNQPQSFSSALGQHSLYSTTPMEKLLNYQVEQERILEETKLQISQHFSLSEIIQTTIDHSCKSLELDRLLIFQLDVPQQLDCTELKSIRRVDTITYEARKIKILPRHCIFRKRVAGENPLVASINITKGLV